MLHSSRLSAVALLLVAVGVFGAVEHQLSTAARYAQDADRIVGGRCEPGTALHIDPVPRTHNDCIVCRLGSPTLSPNAMAQANASHIDRALAAKPHSLPVVRRLEASRSRAPPVS